MVNSPTRYALENLRVSSKFGDIQLTLIAKEDNQQAVNAKDRFAHFPSWRRSLDNLDDFAVVFRRRGRRSERYQQMMIRITARGRRRTRRTKHGSETHVSSPMCTHPNHGQPRLNGTRHFRSGSISTSSAAFTDVHSRRILLLLLLQRLLLPPSEICSSASSSDPPAMRSPGTTSFIYPRRHRQGYITRWMRCSCGPPCGPFSRRVWSR